MTDTWRNVQPGCLLCRMDKRTHWYNETENWVVAEKLGGGPFVVSKTHQTDLSEAEWEEMEKVVGQTFDDFEIQIIMSHCPNHWHGHLRNYTFLTTDEDIDLSDE